VQKELLYEEVLDLKARLVEGERAGREREEGIEREQKVGRVRDQEWERQLVESKRQLAESKRQLAESKRQVWGL
jgi:hypothetical protein